MTDDQLFRFVLIAGMAIVLPVGVYFRMKSHTGEKLDRLQEGLVILILLRLMGVAGMAGVVAFVVDPNLMAWASVPLPAWLRWTGAALGVPAAFWLAWTFRTLGKNLTDTVVTRKEHTLVTTGPYRWVRHPFTFSSGWLSWPTRW